MRIRNLPIVRAVVSQLNAVQIVQVLMRFIWTENREAARHKNYVFYQKISICFPLFTVQAL